MSLCNQYLSTLLNILVFVSFNHGIMESTSKLIQAMNDITLEEEEESGIAIPVTKDTENFDILNGLDAKLCLVGRFITEGVIDFTAMKHTLAALWKPGRGVFIREVETNLYLFQFYHEIDIKRVIEGSPWSFNRKVLIIARMKEGEIPRGVNLNRLDLWVQIHDMRPGFMPVSIIREIGNYIREHIESCSKNFKNVWKEYMRVRVSIDLSKPLKRRMKLRKSDAEWFWITFKYENVPMFCFICGLLGHSDKFCSKLFDTPESDIIKPYGAWMIAPPRRQNNLIGARWLRDGTENNGGVEGDVRSSGYGESTEMRMRAQFTPENSGSVVIAEKKGEVNLQNNIMGGRIPILNQEHTVRESAKSIPGIEEITNCGK